MDTYGLKREQFTAYGLTWDGFAVYGLEEVKYSVYRLLLGCQRYQDHKFTAF
jgi:hypothetical protein